VRYFELRDALEFVKAGEEPELEFYRGAVDAAFNRMDEAIRGLRSYLEKAAGAGSGREMARPAWVLLADAYRRIGRYRESAEAQRRIIDLFGAGLDADERANRENQLLLWSALADVPPTSVDVPEEISIRLDNRLFPVMIQGREIPFSYDTGSSLSVLYASAARELGLTLRGEGAKVEAGTGRWIDSRLAVVPELRLGKAVIRNAVFLVFPDDFFPVRKNGSGQERRGFLGAPVLNALKEISETSDGRLLISAAPQPRNEHNMFFYGYKPVVDASQGKERLRLFVDNGSALTFLYPTYFQRHQMSVEARSTAREITMGSAGGERKVVVRVIDQFSFRVSGRDFVLPNVMVYTEFTSSDTKIFDGTLGRDVLSPGMKVTMNFESMTFLLKEADGTPSAGGR
jgi:hypothetical protein